MSRAEFNHRLIELSFVFTNFVFELPSLGESTASAPNITLVLDTSSHIDAFLVVLSG